MPVNSKVQALLDQYGKTTKNKPGILTTLGKLNLEMEPYSTGILTFDYILGGGLFPRKAYEIYGPEASGKSLLLYHAIAAIQRRAEEGKKGHIAVLFDSERASDTREWLEFNGVDVDNLIYLVGTAEEGMEALLHFARDPDVGMLAIDSIASMATNTEMDHKMDQREVASVAGLMPKFFKRYMSTAVNSNLFMINQVREDIGSNQSYGEALRTVGGRPVRHWSSSRILVRGRRNETSTGKGFQRIIHGMDIYMKAEKNRLGREGSGAYFRYMFDKGVDHALEAYMLGKVTGVLQSKGAWVVWHDEHGQEYRANGEAKFKEIVTARPELLIPLRTQILLNSKKNRVITDTVEEYEEGEYVEGETAEEEALV